MQPAELRRVEEAQVSGDYDTANVTVGEGIGLIDGHTVGGGTWSAHLGRGERLPRENMPHLGPRRRRAGDGQSLSEVSDARSRPFIPRRGIVSAEHGLFTPVDWL